MGYNQTILTEVETLLGYGPVNAIKKNRTSESKESTDGLVGCNISPGGSGGGVYREAKIIGVMFVGSGSITNAIVPFLPKFLGVEIVAVAYGSAGFTGDKNALDMEAGLSELGKLGTLFSNFTPFLIT